MAFLSSVINTLKLSNFAAFRSIPSAIVRWSTTGKVSARTRCAKIEPLPIAPLMNQGCLAKVTAMDRCPKLAPPCGAPKVAESKPIKRRPYKIDPECCNDPCPGVHPRFDDLFYTPSDMEDRDFQQTWSECPKLTIAKKPRCFYEKLEYPHPPKRTHKRMTCEVPSWCLLMMMCRNKANTKCAKITWPGCGPCRNPPHCQLGNREITCRKVCTPYPSFSECKRDRPKERRPVECNCLKVGPICKVN